MNKRYMYIVVPVAAWFLGGSTVPAQSPAVSSVTPSPNTIGVNAASDIKAVFDRNMNPSTLNHLTMIVDGRFSGRHSGQFQSAADSVVFNPNDDFLPGEVVTVTLTAGVESDSGEPLENGYSWSFIADVSNGSRYLFDSDYGTGNDPRAVVTADFDSDGYLDLAVANHDDNSVLILTGQGDGTFVSGATYSVGAGPVAMVAADVDEVNGMDLITADETGQTVTVLMNMGTGAFGPITSYSCDASPLAVEVVDLDQDGWPEIAVADYNNNQVQVLPNLGSGLYGTAELFSVGAGGGFGPVSIAAGDLDDDGYPDLVTANYWSNNVTVLTNNGSGGLSTCAPVSVGTHPQSVCVADLDGDGDLDLATADVGADSVSVLLNDGGCAFSSGGRFAVGDEPNFLTAGDLDGDHDLDIFLTNGLDGSCTVLGNDSQADFGTDWEYTCNQNPQSVCVGDFDSDGKLDFATANSGADNISVHLNRIFPSINAHTPAHHELNVDPAVDLTISFSVSMKSSSFTADPPAIIVSGSVSGPHDGDIVYSSLDLTVTFDPLVDFHPGEVVTAFLREGMESMSSIPMDSSFIWSFTVAAEHGDTLQARTAYEVGAGPWEIMAADFDQDGYIDITDLDGNGYLDIATANLDSDDISVLLNNGDGSFDNHRLFALEYGWAPISIAAGDLNGDGQNDLAVANRDFDNVAIMINNGDSTFSRTQTVTVGNGPETLRTGDLDNDGDIDLAVANKQSDNVTILWNDGAATFSSQDESIIGGSTGPFGLYLADMDRDGQLDIITADSGSNDVAILLNAGETVFSPIGPFAAGSEPQAVVIADMNGDGFPDIVVSNEMVTQACDTCCTDCYYVSVLINRGDSTFAPQTFYQVGERPYSVTAADLDNDGDIDLASADVAWNPYGESDSISVLYNRSFTYVMSHLPGVNEIGADPSANIIVQFNHEMADTSIDNGTILVAGSFTGATDCVVMFDEAHARATINPTVDFLAGEVVSVIVTNEIVSSEGYALDRDMRWSFTAGVVDSGGSFEATVEYPGGDHPWSVLLADFDRDQHLDMVCANENSDDVSVYINNGDGSFSAGPGLIVGSRPRSVAAVDVDGDTYLDLVTADYDDFAVSVLLNNQDGTFGAATSYVLDAGPIPRPASIAGADLDLDGDADLVTANVGSSTMAVLWNNGSGFFDAGQSSYSVSTSPRSVVVADFDDDGDIDVATAGAEADSITIRWNDGAGSFDDRDDYLVADDCSPRSMVAVDLDGDGDLDLATANEDSDNISVLLNQGGHSFVNAGNMSVGENPFTIVAGDFDGDSDIDLATVDFFGNSASILLNWGDGSFLPRCSIALDNYWPSSICAGDLDGDADLDLVAAGSSSGNIRVLANVADAGSSCCAGRVGDANGQGGDEPTIGDVSVMIDAKFITGTCDGIIECFAEADINQSGGLFPTCDNVTIGDISVLIDYLFITGPSLGLAECL